MKPDTKWLHTLPETDAECLMALARDDALLEGCLQGLFICRRNLGDNLLDAYQAALEVSISTDEVTP